MSVYLDKIDSDGNRVIFQGKRFEISKTRGKSQWSFFHRLIKNSGKRIDELKSLKPKQVMALIISQEDCAITKEDLDGYDSKPLVTLFRRCLRYEEEVDIYNVFKDGDIFAWWCETASDDEIVRLILSGTYKNSWTKNMYTRLHRSMKATTLYRLFEAIKEENWEEVYGKESQESKTIFSNNNTILEVLENCKGSITKNCECFYIFYDKLVYIYLNRLKRHSRFMGSIKEVLGRLRRVEPRVFLTTATLFESTPAFNESLDGNMWDHIRAFRYIDTDYKKIAVRSHLNCGWSTPEKNLERYNELLYQGSSGYKGVGFHDNMTKRMGLWQLL